MPVEIRPASCFAISDVCQILNKCFEEYFVPVSFTEQAFQDSLRVDSIDLASSLVILRKEIPVAIGLIARRNNASRLAGMAVHPECRHQGFGRNLLNELIAQARSRQDQLIALEVINDNHAARALYRSVRFSRVRDLAGYIGNSVAARVDSCLQRIDLRDVSEQLKKEKGRDLPWQADAATVEQFGSAAEAFRLGPAYAVATPGGEHHMRLRILIVDPGSRQKGWGRRMVQALAAHYSISNWSMPPYAPAEAFDPFFNRIGFARMDLSQIQMELPLQI